jgi:hypothetical protein
MHFGAMVMAISKELILWGHVTSFSRHESAAMENGNAQNHSRSKKLVACLGILPVSAAHILCSFPVDKLHA